MVDGNHILCDLTFKGDPAGHGGHHRSCQIREMVEAAGFQPQLLEPRIELGNLAKYAYGLASLWHYRIRPSVNWRWVRRWGICCYRYAKAIESYQGSRVLVWENTRVHNQVAVCVARAAGFQVIATPQNLEAFDTGVLIRRPRQFPHRRFLAEAEFLARAQAIFCISREEPWLLAWSGIQATFLPYYPPKAVLDRSLKVRQCREQTPRRPRLLLLGTAGNPPTRQGMMILLEWLAPIATATAIKVDIVGLGTDRLQAHFDSSAFQFHGRIETAQLNELLAHTQAVLVHQPAAVGALTRIPEMLAAGIPVIGNAIACRSAADLAGVYVYESAAELGALLHAPLPVPPIPVPPVSGQERFIGCLRALASPNLVGVK